MKAIVTGGAGFVGSHMVKRLVGAGAEVIIIDNFRTGKLEFIQDLLDEGKVNLVEADLRELDAIKSAFEGQEIVYHLAANADVRGGVKDTKVDLEENVIATRNVLEAMKEAGVKKLVFLSSTQVYGEAPVPTPEDVAPMLPGNIYGASKLAAEAYVSAFAQCFGMRAWIFRPVNLVGKHGTHGVISDFIDKLRENSEEMEILGDGKQMKSYIHIEDGLDEIEYVLGEVPLEEGRVEIFNMGNVDWISVTELAGIVVEEMGLENVKFNYTGGDRGWVGDVPRVLLSMEKMKKLGWVPKRNAAEAVRIAARTLVEEKVGKK